MKWVDLSAAGAATALRNAQWALVYSTVDQSLADIVALQKRAPGVAMFGCTSSAGVFTPKGFVRGKFALVAEKDPLDPRAEAELRDCSSAGARKAAREAAIALTAKLGRRPDTLLLHATPGFEERLLEGFDDAFDGAARPIYGGSAADDDLSGQWQVFCGGQTSREGFVLVGFVSDRPIHGSLVAGYIPGKHRGIVTRVRGRTVYEIDRRPAAEVYNEWRDGALDRWMETGGVVLADTTLNPLGRLIDRVGSVPRYLLSHPHEVVRDGHALTFFTEFAVGDEVAMMVGSRASLLERTEQAITRALGKSRTAHTLRGGVLVYCAGCVMAIGEAAQEVASLYERGIGGVPFVGAATFGEVGCFTGSKDLNRHGNLMCDTVLFT